MCPPVSNHKLERPQEYFFVISSLCIHSFCYHHDICDDDKRRTGMTNDDTGKHKEEPEGEQGRLGQDEDERYAETP